VTDESATLDLLRSCRRSALHLEMRDSYTPNDPDWRDWREGRRFEPAERWREWFDLATETTARGISVRRARIVSEPVTDYIAFEYAVTTAHNVAAGELVRWLPRHVAPGVLVPCSDFWVFDDETVVFNHFDGVGDWVREELRREPELALTCAAAFRSVWDLAIPHEKYVPPLISR